MDILVEGMVGVGVREEGTSRGGKHEESFQSQVRGISLSKQGKSEG